LKQNNSESQRFIFRRVLTRLNKDFIDNRSNVIVSPRVTDYKPVVADYLTILRKRYGTNKYSILSLQLHLLQDIDLCEKSIREFKRQKESTNDEKTFKAIDVEIYSFELIRNCLKYIGDALAWKFLDYGRTAVFLFSNRPDPGYLNYEGLMGEAMAFLRRSFGEDNFSVLNCITNCLRIGDIVTKTKDGFIEVEEIKSSSKSGRNRLSSQLKTMDDLSKFLNERKKFEGGKETRIISTSFYPQNYFDKVRDAINAAQGKGYATIKLNDYSFVDVFRYNRIDDFDKAISFLEQQHRAAAPNWEGPSLFFSNYDRFEFSPVIAPYSIYPFSEHICTEILFGELNISLFVNFRALGDYLQKKGWDIVESPEQIAQESEFGFNEKVFVVRKGNFHTNIPPMIINKVLFEFCHPNVIAKEIDAMMKAITPGEVPLVFLENEGQKSQWR
jgi:hypothetical protein